MDKQANTDTKNQLLEELTTFTPLITEEQINQAEKFEKDRHRKRRLMLLILTKDAKELFAQTESDPSTAEEVFYFVADYAHTVRMLLEMSQACCTRLMASLSGIDDEEMINKILSEWDKVMAPIRKSH